MSSLQTIQNMMVKQFDLKLEDLTPDATLEGLGLDSLSVIEFTFNLEDELKITMPDERVELKTLQDVVNLVDKLDRRAKRRRAVGTMTRRVVITGLGVISPVGKNPAEFFSNLMAGRSGIKRLQNGFRRTTLHPHRCAG